MQVARMLLKTLVISALFSPALAFAGAGVIEEIGIGSTVKVSRNGGSVLRLKKGDALQSGDELSTDATTSVDIRLEDSTLIRVGVSSVYKVQEDSQIHALVHRLLSGVVRVMVKPNESDGKKEAPIKFRMYTPEGTIGVRGTEFVVTRTEGRTELKGLDGVVVFGPADTDFAKTAEFVKVERGFQSTISANHIVGRPERYDFKAYRDLINGKSGPFAPLSSRGSSGSGNKYVREEQPKSTGGTTVAALDSGSKNRENLESPKPPAPISKAEKVDYQMELTEAIEKGDVDKAKHALERGARADYVGDKSGGKTPLQLAMAFKQERIFEILIVHGANVDKKDEDGFTPLMFVAENHLDMAFAKALLNPGGANIMVKSRDGQLAEDIAVKSDYKELAEYLKSEEGASDSAKGVELKEERNKGKKKK